MLIIATDPQRDLSPDVVKHLLALTEQTNPNGSDLERQHVIDAVTDHGEPIPYAKLRDKLRDQGHTFKDGNLRALLATMDGRITKGPDGWEN